MADNMVQGRCGARGVLLTIGLVLMALGINFLPLASDVFAQDAERMVTMGTRLHQQGRYAEAIDMFKRSFEQNPDVARFMDIARSLDADKKLPEAVSYYRQYLEQGFDSTLIAEAEERIDALSQELAKTMSEIRFLSVPIGVEVFEEGSEVALGKAPFSFWFPFGSHKFIFKQDGFVTVEKTVQVRSGDSERVLVELEEDTNYDWGEFAVEGGQQGYTESASEPFLGIPTTSWVSLGVGVVGLAAGTGFGISATNKADEAKNYDRMAADASMTKEIELIDAAQGAATAANIGFAVGGVGVAASLLFYFLHGPITF